jgi:hypothetical protein
MLVLIYSSTDFESNNWQKYPVAQFSEWPSRKTAFN